MFKNMYRGVNEENNELVFGYYCFNPYFKRAEIFSFKNERSYVYKVDPDTVGCFTGGYDSTNWDSLSPSDKCFWSKFGYTEKNWKGIPIFVGDLVKEGCNGFIREVVWDNEEFTFKLKGLGIGYCIQNAVTDWTVIGLASENPHLIK